jgi:flagellin-like hook-associated protein FlgL
MKIGSINTIAIQNQIKASSQAYQRVLGQMSEGTRLAPFRADSVSSSIANGLSSRVRGLAQTSRDLNQAQAMLLSADDALQSQGDVAQKMRELSLQATNSTLSSSERANLQTELSSLLQEFDRIANATEVAGRNLLQSSSSFSVLASDQAGDSFEVQLESSLSVNNFREVRGSGFFLNEESFDSSGSLASETKVVELDSSGTKALAYAVSGSTTIRFEMLDGEGNLTGETVDFATSLPGAVVNFELGDVTGNGISDLIIYRANSVFFYEGKGDGDFEPRTNISTLGAGFGGSALQLADFDGDGIKDIVVGNGGSSVRVLQSNGDGTFTTTNPTLSAGVTGSRIKVGDFNQNGIMDILVMASDSGNGQLLLGNGDGTFTAQATQAFGTGATDHQLEMVDFDGDGVLDIAVGGTGATSVNLFRGNGNGGFDSAGSVAAGYSVNRFAFGDLDDDGKMDLVISGTGVAASIYTGDGDANFELQKTIAGTAGALNVLDVTGDGIKDVLVSRSTANGGMALIEGIGLEQSGVSFLQLGSAEEAARALSIVDTAIENILNKQASIGAQLNRLDANRKSQESLQSSYADADEEIRSLDYALATSELVRLSILQQSQVAILSQALDQQNVALALLQTGGLNR